MKNRSFFAASIVLLLISAAVLMLLYLPGFVAYFPFFMWIHVAIVVLGILGFWRLRKLCKAAEGDIFSFLKSISPWLIVIAVPVVIAVAPIWSSQNFDLGTTTDGRPIHRKSWHQEKGRYFVQINNERPVEIAAIEYERLQRNMFAVFARGWVLFSYILLVQWKYIAYKERYKNVL